MKLTVSSNFTAIVFKHYTLRTLYTLYYTLYTLHYTLYVTAIVFKLYVNIAMPESTGNFDARVMESLQFVTNCPVFEPYLYKTVTLTII